ncbi:MAG: hypothetical protein ACR2RE_03895 [Geminicoccaceae bacterium]
MGFFLAILVSVALSVISFALAPKPKTAKPAASRDLDNPTADAGRPIPVVFGTVTVKGGNVLWYGDKNKLDYKVKA